MEKASRILVPLGMKILPGCSGVQIMTEYGLWSSLVDHSSHSQTQGMIKYNQTLLLESDFFLDLYLQPCLLSQTSDFHVPLDLSLDLT